MDGCDWQIMMGFVGILENEGYIIYTLDPRVWLSFASPPPTISSPYTSLSLSLSLSVFPAAMAASPTALSIAGYTRVVPSTTFQIHSPGLIPGGAHFETCALQSTKLKTLGGHQSRLAYPWKSNRSKPHQSLSVRSEYSDGSRGGGGDFIAGFLLGGAVFGTLAYVFAPQIRRSILNEDEYGFQRAKRPMYYDEGLEKTRQTLNEKISQLNSAIDNVSSRLRGGNNAPPEQVEADSEVEATM